MMASAQVAEHEDRVDSRVLNVLTLVDSLDIGGTERVAVSIANRLAADGHHSYLCTTRQEGPLAKVVSPAVGRLSLSRSRTIEWKAIRRLVQFIREHKIEILHAHSSSVLTANLASRFSPYPKIVWHDHFGPNDQQERSAWVYRGLTKRVGGVITVSQPLADWSRDRLRFPESRIWCLPNFVDVPESSESPVELPGQPGNRIVCVANVRPVKDHSNLVQAMKIVVAKHPQAHLFLVGGLTDSGCVASLRSEIDDLNLESHVSLLGPREDVGQILSACDIGVLSSKSEGLPVSLLEYGAAGLPVVITDVGQCSVVVDHGEAGMLVPPQDPRAHADAMIELLDSESKRKQLGERYLEKVKKQYSSGAVIEQLSEIYDTVLAQ